MRKFVVALMLTISFALGAISQNLIVETWGLPLTPTINYTGSDSIACYTIPNGRKMLGAHVLGSAGKILAIHFEKSE